MISRTTAALSGVLGGLCWIARYVLDSLGVTPWGGDLAAILWWAGGTWLALALMSAGAGLARKSALWLRALIAVAVLLLALVALSLAYPAFSRLLVDAVFGGLVALTSLIALARRPGPGAGNHTGNHTGSPGDGTPGNGSPAAHRR